VAYLGGPVPADVFADNRTQSLTYFNVADLDAEFPEIKLRVPPRRFVLLSFAPDVDSSNARASAAAAYPVSNSTLHPILGPYMSYDPTNGTISRGDIYSFGVKSMLSLPDPPIVAPVAATP
jgi:hypothetical protein